MAGTEAWASATPLEVDADHGRPDLVAGVPRSPTARDPTGDSQCRVYATEALDRDVDGGVVGQLIAHVTRDLDGETRPAACRDDGGELVSRSEWVPEDR